MKAGTKRKAPKKRKKTIAEVPASDAAPQASRGPGNPSPYQPEYCTQARVLARLGATDAELAEAFEVTRRTIFNWRAAHPEFDEACQVGKEVADNRVERSLYELAVGWGDQPPHAGACFGWLYNRCPEKWKRRQEITGKDGAPLIPVTSTMPLAEMVAAYAQIVAAEDGDMPADEPDEPEHVPDIPDQS